MVPVEEVAEVVAPGDLEDGLDRWTMFEGRSVKVANRREHARQKSFKGDCRCIHTNAWR